MNAIPIKKEEEIPNVPGVSLGRLKKIAEVFERRVEAAREANGETEEINIDEMEVSFDYIVGSLFPTVYKNIMDEITRKYGEGYIQGREDMKNEIEGSN